MLESVDPEFKLVWDLIPKTYISLKRLADTHKGALPECEQAVLVFDTCHGCNEFVYDG